jgi:hypothetical protein
MDDPALRKRMGAFGRARVERELQWSCVGKNLAGAYRALSGACSVGTRSCASGAVRTHQ